MVTKKILINFGDILGFFIHRTFQILIMERELLKSLHIIHDEVTAVDQCEEDKNKRMQRDRDIVLCLDEYRKVKEAGYHHGKCIQIVSVFMSADHVEDFAHAIQIGEQNQNEVCEYRGPLIQESRETPVSQNVKDRNK